MQEAGIGLERPGGIPPRRANGKGAACNINAPPRPIAFISIGLDTANVSVPAKRGKTYKAPNDSKTIVIALLAWARCR